jgi:hypothetical protein
MGAAAFARTAAMPGRLTARVPHACRGGVAAAELVTSASRRQDNATEREGREDNFPV